MRSGAIVRTPDVDFEFNRIALSRNLKVRPSKILLVTLFLLTTNTFAQNGGLGQGGMGHSTHRYLYVVTPGIRDYTEFGGAGILVFDIDQNHKFVKRIETTASKVEKPRNIKGVCGFGNRIYFTTPEKLYCVDVATEKTLWEVSPPNGCDRMSILPNAKTLYVPSFEKDTWNVIDGEDGKVVAEIETKSGAHNTVVSRDGTRMYMGGLKSPNIFVADTSSHKIIQQIGPFSAAIRPFTINGDRTRAYVCVNELLGFEIGDLTTGKVLHRVEVTGFKQGPVKRHGCPSHGVGLTPNEREVWVVDAANEHVHIFDNTVTPPKQIQSIKLREQPGWITFSIDGEYAYPSTGEVISTRTKQIVSLLTDEMGREVHSEKMLEVHKVWQDAKEFGDQFGVGRVAVKYQRKANGEALAATAIGLPMMYTPQCYSGPFVENVGGETLITDAMAQLNFCFLGAAVQLSDRANRPIVKLNFVTATEQIAAQVPGVVQKIYGNENSPPISVVVGKLPNDSAVGVDAVAVYDHPVAGVYTQMLEASPGMARIAPRGPRVFIAGQAEKGSTPAQAAANTIASLKRTLDWLGCDSHDSLQAKCFLTPMSAAKEVRREFDKAFGDNQLPLVFVEWKSDLPIEIELIAQAPPAAADAPAIEFLTPPEMKASPIYSRVVRVNRGNWIYTTGMFNESPKADNQVLGIFDELSQILKSSKSDFSHLVKATYYVSNDQTSKSLNDLRPKFYDPSSPPSASKAMIPSCGRPESGIVMDMIAITNE